MIRKYHNHTLQPNPRHYAEELQPTYSLKTIKVNQLALPCLSRLLQNKEDTKYWIAKQGPNAEPPETMRAKMYKQQQNYRLRM